MTAVSTQKIESPVVSDDLRSEDISIKLLQYKYNNEQHKTLYRICNEHDEETWHSSYDRSEERYDICHSNDNTYQNRIWQIEYR